MIPHSPQRTILRPQPPQSECLQTKVARRPHFIQRRYPVQHPDLVTLLRVLIVVSKVRIQRSRLQMQLCTRIRGHLPSRLHVVEHVRANDFG